MNKFSKKIAVFISVIIVALGALAFKFFHYTPVKPDENPQKIVQDQSRTKQLKGENKVLDGQVYVQGGKVVVTMVIKDDVSKEDINSLVDEYGKKLKKEYKDMDISIQAVQKNKNVADVKINK